MLILAGEDGYTQSLKFSSDAATLYDGHGFRGLWAWDLAARTAARLVFGGERMTHTLLPLPGGRWAVGYSTAETPPPRYNALRLIDLAAGTARPFLVFPSHSAVAGEWLAGLGHSQYDEDRTADSPRQRVYGFALTADGPQYAWHSDVPAGVNVREVAALGPDRVAVYETVPLGSGVFQSVAWRVRMTVRRAADGTTEAELDYPHLQAHQVLGSPDGTKLVARFGMELRVWDAADWKRPPRVIEGIHKGTMSEPAAAFTPDGRFLLLANDGPSVLVYDTTSWAVVRKWKWDVGVLRVVAVSPDGSLAAAAGPRGRIAVWDLDL